MINWLKLSETVLSNSRNSSLHVRDIASSIKESNPTIDNDVDDIMNKVSSSLAGNVKSKNPTFKKIKNKQGGLKRGFYALKIRKIDPLKKALIEDDGNKVGTLYTGKAGEYAVLSELMFRGYNSTILPIDDGIDVIAEKDNKYHHIQVKTSNQSLGNNFQFTIKQSSFDIKNISQTYYIFVMRYIKSNRRINDFAIFHTREIQNYISSGTILSKPSMSIRIGIENNQYFLNNSADITSNINNFNIA